MLVATADGVPSLPDGFSFTSAEFVRIGSNLVLTAADGTEIIVVDFFAHASLPTLVSAGGATIVGNVAAKLADSLAAGQNASLVPPDMEPIGSIETLGGDVTVIRGDGHPV